MKKLTTVLLLSLIGCHSLDRFMPDRHNSSSLEPVYQGPLEEKILVGAPGQSNLLGRGQNEWFPVHPRVTLTRDLPVGPAYYAASRLADAHPNWHITLVECSEGGVSIDAWLPGQFLYERCVSETKAVVEATGGEVIGLLAYQGEANARGWATFSPDWPDKFEFIVESFITAIGVNAPCIWAQLGQLRNTEPQEYQDTWTLFKQNQLTVSLNNSTMIVTDDQPVVDDVHHGAEANKVIGQRFYDALVPYL